MAKCYYKKYFKNNFNMNDFLIKLMSKFKLYKEKFSDLVKNSKKKIEEFIKMR